LTTVPQALEFVDKTEQSIQKIASQFIDKVSSKTITSKQVKTSTASTLKKIGSLEADMQQALAYLQSNTELEGKELKLAKTVVKNSKKVVSMARSSVKAAASRALARVSKSAVNLFDGKRGKPNVKGCNYSRFSYWSTCSAHSAGMQMRSSVLLNKKSKDAKCTPIFTESRPCTAEAMAAAMKEALRQAKLKAAALAAKKAHESAVAAAHAKEAKRRAHDDEETDDTPIAPKGCVYSKWSSWTTCSAHADGQQMRTRVLVRTLTKKRQCPAALTDVKRCSKEAIAAMLKAEKARALALIAAKKAKEAELARKRFLAAKLEKEHMLAAIRRANEAAARAKAALKKAQAALKAANSIDLAVVKAQAEAWKRQAIALAKKLGTESATEFSWKKFFMKLSALKKKRDASPNGSERQVLGKRIDRMKNVVRAVWRRIARRIWRLQANAAASEGAERADALRQVAILRSKYLKLRKQIASWCGWVFDHWEQVEDHQQCCQVKPTVSKKPAFDAAPYVSAVKRAGSKGEDKMDQAAKKAIAAIKKQGKKNVSQSRSLKEAALHKLMNKMKWAITHVHAATRNAVDQINAVGAMRHQQALMARGFKKRAALIKADINTVAKAQVKKFNSKKVIKSVKKVTGLKTISKVKKFSGKKVIAVKKFNGKKVIVKKFTGKKVAVKPFNGKKVIAVKKFSGKKVVTITKKAAAAVEDRLVVAAAKLKSKRTELSKQLAQLKKQLKTVKAAFASSKKSTLKKAIAEIKASIQSLLKSLEKNAVRIQRNKNLIKAHSRRTKA